MKVQNIINSKGNPVANQFIIRHNGNVYFQSYDSLIAVIDGNNHVILSDLWDYSKTTKQYLYMFLNSNWNGQHVDKDVINTLISDGTIELLPNLDFENITNTL